MAAPYTAFAMQPSPAFNVRVSGDLFPSTRDERVADGDQPESSSSPTAAASARFSVKFTSSDDGQRYVTTTDSSGMQHTHRIDGAPSHIMVNATPNNNRAGGGNERRYSDVSTNYPHPHPQQSTAAVNPMTFSAFGNSSNNTTPTNNTHTHTHTHNNNTSNTGNNRVLQDSSAESPSATAMARFRPPSPPSRWSPRWPPMNFVSNFEPQRFETPATILNSSNNNNNNSSNNNKNSNGNGNGNSNSSNNAVDHNSYYNEKQQRPRSSSQDRDSTLSWRSKQRLRNNIPFDNSDATAATTNTNNNNNVMEMAGAQIWSHKDIISRTRSRLRPNSTISNLVSNLTINAPKRLLDTITTAITNNSNNGNDSSSNNRSGNETVSNEIANNNNRHYEPSEISEAYTEDSTATEQEPPPKIIVPQSAFTSIPLVLTGRPQMIFAEPPPKSPPKRKKSLKSKPERVNTPPPQRRLSNGANVNVAALRERYSGRDTPTPPSQYEQCGMCKKPITNTSDRCVPYKVPIHLSCFQCSSCDRQLSVNEWDSEDGKFFCKKCVIGFRNLMNIPHPQLQSQPPQQHQHQHQQRQQQQPQAEPEPEPELQPEPQFHSQRYRSPSPPPAPPSPEPQQPVPQLFREPETSPVPKPAQESEPVSSIHVDTVQFAQSQASTPRHQHVTPSPRQNIDSDDDNINDNGSGNGNDTDRDVNEIARVLRRLADFGDEMIGELVKDTKKTLNMGNLNNVTLGRFISSIDSAMSQMFPSQSINLQIEPSSIAMDSFATALEDNGKQSIISQQVVEQSIEQPPQPAVEVIKCTLCGDSINDRTTLVQNGRDNYHQACLVCAHCDVVVDVSRSVRNGSKLYCQHHSSTLLRQPRSNIPLGRTVFDGSSDTSPRRQAASPVGGRPRTNSGSPRTHLPESLRRALSPSFGGSFSQESSPPSSASPRPRTQLDELMAAETRKQELEARGLFNGYNLHHTRSRSQYSSQLPIPHLPPLSNPSQQHRSPSTDTVGNPKYRPTVESFLEQNSIVNH
ncbi:hypothetical protein GQ42DRAFT_178975 [Ramicandelaber brevisporus]|nr:hypothetical protein GQ42DRAFT_178975 [Ramicandelaber brevisporus]